MAKYSHLYWQYSLAHNFHHEKSPWALYKWYIPLQQISRNATLSQHLRSLGKAWRIPIISYALDQALNVTQSILCLGFPPWADPVMNLLVCTFIFPLHRERELRWVISSMPSHSVFPTTIYRWENEGWERKISLSKMVRLVRKEAGIWAHVQTCCSLLLTYSLLLMDRARDGGQDNFKVFFKIPTSRRPLWFPFLEGCSDPLSYKVGRMCIMKSFKEDSDKTAHICSWKPVHQPIQSPRSKIHDWNPQMDISEIHEPPKKHKVLCACTSCIILRRSVPFSTDSQTSSWLKTGLESAPLEKMCSS